MGHLGAALAARSMTPRIALPLLLAAALGPDLLEIVSGFAGAAGDWIHSIPAMAALALCAGAIYGGLRKQWQAGALLGALALTHPLFDLITSRVPAWPGGPQVGLHLYLFDVGDFLLETALVTVGWLLYLKTLPRERRGCWAAWAMLAALVGFQLIFQLMPIT